MRTVKKAELRPFKGLLGFRFRIAAILAPGQLSGFLW